MSAHKTPDNTQSDNAEQSRAANASDDSRPPVEETAGIAFDEALAELEQIVGRLEEGTLGLEEALREFEKAVQLLRTCHATLQRAEQRIEQLIGFDEDGRPQLAPFEAPATFDENSKND